MKTNIATNKSPRMSPDVADSAEGRIWLKLWTHAPISVNDLCVVVELTPQYTRKTLRGLERAGLSVLDASIMPNRWSACGHVSGLIRHAKSRDLLSSSRSRRALSIRIWRLLKRSTTPVMVGDIAKWLRLDAATTQSALRFLKARNAVATGDTTPSGSRSLPLIALGTQAEMIAALDLPEIRTPTPPPAFPRVNSVWALGAAL